MTLQLDLNLYQLIMILFAIGSAFWGAGKLLGSQIKTNIDQQLKTSRDASEQGFQQTQQMLTEVSRQAAQGQADIRRLELDFYKFQAELPHHYVAREDYIRGQTVIEAKLDAVAEKLEKVQIKQGVNRGDN